MNNKLQAQSWLCSRISFAWQFYKAIIVYTGLILKIVSSHPCNKNGREPQPYPRDVESVAE
jgi:hypothetical protein